MHDGRMCVENLLFARRLRYGDTNVLILTFKPISALQSPMKLEREKGGGIKKRGGALSYLHV